MSRNPSAPPSLGHRLSHSILTWVIGAIVLALIVGSIRVGGRPIVPKPVGNIFATFSDLFSQFLSFAIPLIIIGLVTPAIADLGRGAGKWLGVTTALAYTSTLFAGFLTFLVCAATFPRLLAGTSLADVAAGGQGAPLMPAFHAHVFAGLQGRYGILNLGGIANLTVIDTQRPTPTVIGFDTGPANTLLDGWIEAHHGHRYDHHGQWAASGRTIPALLERLLAEPYFARPAPKSTGRDLFNLSWLKQHLQAHPDAAAADVQATLLALTAESTAQAIRTQKLSAVYLCGGGAENAGLVQAIQQAVGPETLVQSTHALGIAPQAVEASGFAWLARQRVHEAPIPLTRITGSRHDSILGAWHKAPSRQH